MTTVAAIIPTRDRAELTERAVRSVLAQTRPVDELIVVDDGSVDDTSQRLRAAFPQITLLRLEGRGVSAARNHAIRAASSEWLAFLDSDDEWLPEKLHAQLAALTAEPEMRICHADEIWIRNGRRVNPRRRHRKRGGHIFQHCLPLCAISPSAALVHRSLFDRAGLFDESLPACEDYDLWLRLCSRWPVAYVDRPLLRKYGGHADQLSKTASLDRYRIRALEKILDEQHLEAEHRRAAEATLLGKIDIYLAGVKKRQRWDEARQLETLRQRIASQAEEPTVGVGEMTHG
ncbi:MAG: glycosyltransferase [Acidobacteriota bacterium]